MAGNDFTNSWNKGGRGASCAKGRSQRLKVCLAASAGGHLTQLLKLSECWREYDTFCVTTRDFIKDKLSRYGKVDIVGECNREHLLRGMLVLMRCVKVVLRERPDIVISTGAAAGCIMCFLCKLLGGKVVWVDSITNVGRISLSGRLVRPIADLFLVQWPELVSRYKNVQYMGELV